MSTYNYDKYTIPDKWMMEEFEHLEELCERCQKEKEKQLLDPCPNFEPKKGN